MELRQLYTPADYQRASGSADRNDPSRSDFDRDYARVIHSPSFRRLQGKTQVFPGHESDFFRNRLTHSLEVAQISEGIAAHLNLTDTKFSDYAHSSGKGIDLRLCATAALLHDLGHPPFGHNGERALHDAMGDYGGFEGNAQSLRIAAKVEKKVRGHSGKPYGLDLCYRTLGAILKYDRRLPSVRQPGEKLPKGYYEAEADLVKSIKSAIAGDHTVKEGEFKIIECAIMDIADDIAYSTYDLEDSLKAGFISPAEIFCAPDALVDRVLSKVRRSISEEVSATDLTDVFMEIFTDEKMGTLQRGGGIGHTIETFIKVYEHFRRISSDSYYRTKLSSDLVKKAIHAVKATPDEECPALTKVTLAPEVKLRVEVLKQFTFETTIFSPKVKMAEYRGYNIVRSIFDALAGDKGYLLMPDDVRLNYEMLSGDASAQMRVICDFVAGMTDRYAIEFHARLHSDSAQSMFKPI